MPDKSDLDELREAYALAEFALENMDGEAMREARERIEKIRLGSPASLADNISYVS